MFVERPGRGHKLSEVRDETDHFGAKFVDGHRTPALVVMPPHAGAQARFPGGDESREDRSLRMG